MNLWQSTANFKPNVADVDGQNSLLKKIETRVQTVQKKKLKTSKLCIYVMLNVMYSCQSHDVLTPIFRLIKHLKYTG